MEGSCSSPGTLVSAWGRDCCRRAGGRCCPGCLPRCVISPGEGARPCEGLPQSLHDSVSKMNVSRNYSAPSILLQQWKSPGCWGGWEGFLWRLQEESSRFPSFGGPCSSAYCLFHSWRSLSYTELLRCPVLGPSPPCSCGPKSSRKSWRSADSATLLTLRCAPGDFPWSQGAGCGHLWLGFFCCPLGLPLPWVR